MPWVVGVPVREPVEEFKVSGDADPDVMDHEYGCVPPVAWNVWE
ncbi:MAG TPA: hypothetical protein VEV85_27190 [Bryobacteraceae bacterium]|nr:hypothetical protein [Bryobacteraceae bacterium]